MDFTFTEEQKMWRKVLEEFGKREATIEYIREIDRKKGFAYELYQKVAQQGWLGLIVPEKYGGTDVGAIMAAIFCEVMGSFDISFSIMFSRPMYAVNSIIRYGTEEQKSYYLPRYVSGENYFSGSFTEPEAGSDLASLKCSAVLQGDEFIINGQKIFASGSSVKNDIIVLGARTDKDAPKHKGISLILVPNDTPGLEIRELSLIINFGGRTCELFFDNVRVPKENLIGELNKGWEYLTDYLEFERLIMLAAYLGHSQTVLDDIVTYAKQRVQFGQPIANFQVIRHQLANFKTELEASRLLTYQVASLIEQGIRCPAEAAMAKLFVTDMYSRLTRAGMQILGGYSLDPDTDMERYWRYSIVATVGGGSSEIQREIISRSLLK